MTLRFRREETGTEGRVEGLLEGDATLLHGSADECLNVGFERDGRPHDCIIASNRVMTRSDNGLLEAVGGEDVEEGLEEGAGRARSEGDGAV